MPAASTAESYSSSESAPAGVSYTPVPEDADAAGNPVPAVSADKAVAPANRYKRIRISRLNNGYQIEKFTDKQVFHENVSGEAVAGRCISLMEGNFLELYAWADEKESTISITKKGKLFFKQTRSSGVPVPVMHTHNRQKQYLLPEGQVIAPLVDMGIFTAEGKVVRTMYDKYRQINRFIEIIDDVISKNDYQSLNIIDFGCGKSYLTFIVYYYLTEIRNIDAHIIGLDLKADVIRKCNEAAAKYGYSNLHFEMGDINGYKSPFDVDMVITLHACDTATDYALFNAINWNAKMIFSVPCCQHELNKQMSSDNLQILTRYGIVQERFAALLTDAIRGNILEYFGYKTQLMEFVDLSHTPKNILIRAAKRQSGSSQELKTRALSEIHSAMEEFHVEPTLYRLLKDRL
ncbi:MAG: SAM-dependent methyltransferase [Parasporobacterium sp.]|nr:SAM-dependent methyltransferase [Parasporobacterium sp.]